MSVRERTWDDFDALLQAGDVIGALCLAVKLSGGTMTLNGKPIDERSLRAAALDGALSRVERIAMAGHDPGDEDPSAP